MHSVIQESARKTEVLVKDAKEEEKELRPRKSKIIRFIAIQSFKNIAVNPFSNNRRA
jgi:hypothetical protein